MNSFTIPLSSYIDNMQGLFDRCFGIERESGIDLRRDLARNDLEDLCAELHEEIVQGSINLLVDVATVLLTIRYRSIDELRIFRLLRRSKDEGRVGGGILGLVLVDSSKVPRVANDCLWLQLELVGSGDTRCGHWNCCRGDLRKEG